MLVSLLLLTCAQQIYPVKGGGNLPDASQEGILKQYNSYDDVALFYFTVPPETTRATWEFASFQDVEDCPSREVVIHIQHGSLPVISADNATFARNFYTTRTDLHMVKTHSAFQPHDSTIFPVYNPLPGPWFAIAYLSPFEEKITQQGLLHKCRYSLGSIALWTRAEQVEMVNPYSGHTFTTKKHFSYYKFFVAENVDSFQLNLLNCTVQIHLKERLFGRKDCIEYANLRARALPKHDPNVSGFTNISSRSGVTFTESRPVRSSYYYLLVVSSAVVSFQLQLSTTDCGAAGLYGRNQKHWYLTEEGLKFNDSRLSEDPKEPKEGFQLFTVNSKLVEKDENSDHFDASGSDGSQADSASGADSCYALFDFNRIDLVEKFSTNFVLQGRSWYTKWVTVSPLVPVVTRFKILDYIDIGGMVNLMLQVDPSPDLLVNTTAGQVFQVYGCLSKANFPEITNGSLECGKEERLEISWDSLQLNTTKLIPFPEPDTWYLALQARCVDPISRRKVRCWGNLRFASVMAAVNIHIQPCDYRPSSQICGEFGVCVKSYKNGFLYTSCRCASGYKGWTCDETMEADPAFKLVSDTLLLTLSNLFFLPAILLSLYYRLYTESLLYLATMFFSTFYHTCDQEINHKHLPDRLESICRALYVQKEVLQFCDFFSAIMSFWVTIISMAKLPEKLVNFLHMLGVLLIAVLVQYNRSGIQVFAVPIPLGILILFVTLVVRSYKRRRCLKANKYCAFWISLAVISAVSAVLVFALVETTSNYQYVHSGWHVLIALSLVFLLPYCRRAPEKGSLIFPKTPSTTSEESELPEVSSLDQAGSGESDS